MLNLLVKLKKNRKRVGRGGDRGQTSGKGHKGQKARSGGYVKAQFEGGQTPLTRRLPKRGFNNAAFKKEFTIINIQSFNDIPLIETGITKDLLIQLGFVKSTRNHVKLLGDGEITKAHVFYVDACSVSAKAKVESVGGQVILNY